MTTFEKKDKTQIPEISLVEDRDTWEMCIEFNHIPDSKTLSALTDGEFVGSKDLRAWRRPLGHLSRIAASRVYDTFVEENGPISTAGTNPGITP